MKRVETIKCTCTNGAAAEYQDRRYGKGRRVFTINGKGEACCTVCSAKQRLAVADTPKERKKSTGGSGGAKQMSVLPPRDGWLGGRPEDNGYRRIGSK